MAVAVLPSQDIFTHRHPHLISRRKPNPTPSRSTRRKRNSPTHPGSPPVPGQIRILKRGEALTPRSKPEPEPVHRLIPDGFYSGSAVTSPPPSELPVPAFFTKTMQNSEIASQLKRVLKLF